ncbi:MAG: leucine-rich repeat domain-containing protein [Spirochaetaceae bacterium]|nr:leucine-rich repeat domain-containing protein [Spirochaetaceae bacterium]
MSYTVPAVSGASGSTQEVMFYRRDGAQINLPVLSDSVYTTQGGVDYHTNKWNVQGQVVSGGNVRVNASGDSTISNITQVPDTTYGFRGNELVVNQTSGTVKVNTAGGKSISTIELPVSAADGSITLDLRNVTGLNNIKTSGSVPAVTNGAKIGSVVFPDSNFTLEKNSFRNCSSITSVDLSKCTSVGNAAFTFCTSLVSVGDMSGCLSVASYAFERCTSLKSVNLSNCTSIGKFTCNYCSNLESVGNLSNCTSIGQYAFRGCSKLTSVNLSSCITIEESAFKTTGLTGTINLPACTTIEAHAFEDCTNITSVNLSSCETIGNYAFNGCTSLTSVTFSSNITTIGDGAFNDCDAATTFYFFSSPHNVTYGSAGTSASTFKTGAKAIWDDGTQQYIYTWNRNANGGSGGWE